MNPNDDNSNPEQSSHHDQSNPGPGMDYFLTGISAPSDEGIDVLIGPLSKQLEILDTELMIKLNRLRFSNHESSEKINAEYKKLNKELSDDYQKLLRGNLVLDLTYEEYERNLTRRVEQLTTEMDAAIQELPAEELSMESDESLQESSSEFASLSDQDIYFSDSASSSSSMMSFDEISSYFGTALPIAHQDLQANAAVPEAAKQSMGVEIDIQPLKFFDHLLPKIKPDTKTGNPIFSAHLGSDPKSNKTITICETRWTDGNVATEKWSVKGNVIGLLEQLSVPTSKERMKWESLRDTIARRRIEFLLAWSQAPQTDYQNSFTSDQEAWRKEWEESQELKDQLEFYKRLIKNPETGIFELSGPAITPTEKIWYEALDTYEGQTIWTYVQQAVNRIVVIRQRLEASWNMRQQAKIEVGRSSVKKEIEGQQAGEEQSTSDNLADDLPPQTKNIRIKTREIQPSAIAFLNKVQTAELKFHSLQETYSDNRQRYQTEVERRQTMQEQFKEKKANIAETYVRIDQLVINLPLLEGQYQAVRSSSINMTLLARALDDFTESVQIQENLEMLEKGQTDLGPSLESEQPLLDEIVNDESLRKELVQAAEALQAHRNKVTDELVKNQKSLQIIKAKVMRLVPTLPAISGGTSLNTMSEISTVELKTYIDYAIQNPSETGDNTKSLEAWTGELEHIEENELKRAEELKNERNKIISGLIEQLNRIGDRTTQLIAQLEENENKVPDNTETSVVAQLGRQEKIIEILDGEIDQTISRIDLFENNARVTEITQLIHEISHSLDTIEAWNSNLTSEESMAETRSLLNELEQLTIASSSNEGESPTEVESRKAVGLNYLLHQDLKLRLKKLGIKEYQRIQLVGDKLKELESQNVVPGTMADLKIYVDTRTHHLSNMARELERVDKLYGESFVNLKNGILQEEKRQDALETEMNDLLARFEREQAMRPSSESLLKELAALAGNLVRRAENLDEDIKRVLLPIDDKHRQLQSIVANMPTMSFNELQSTLEHQVIRLEDYESNIVQLEIANPVIRAAKEQLQVTNEKIERVENIAIEQVEGSQYSERWQYLLKLLILDQKKIDSCIWPFQENAKPLRVAQLNSIMADIERVRKTNSIRDDKIGKLERAYIDLQLSERHGATLYRSVINKISTVTDLQKKFASIGLVEFNDRLAGHKHQLQRLLSDLTLQPDHLSTKEARTNFWEKVPFAQIKMGLREMDVDIREARSRFNQFAIQQQLKTKLKAQLDRDTLLAQRLSVRANKILPPIVDSNELVSLTEKISHHQAQIARLYGNVDKLTNIESIHQAHQDRKEMHKSFAMIARRIGTLEKAIRWEKISQQITKSLEEIQQDWRRLNIAKRIQYGELQDRAENLQRLLEQDEAMLKNYSEIKIPSESKLSEIDDYLKKRSHEKNKIQVDWFVSKMPIPLNIPPARAEESSDNLPIDYLAYLAGLDKQQSGNRVKGNSSKDISQHPASSKENKQDDIKSQSKKEPSQRLEEIRNKMDRNEIVPKVIKEGDELTDINESNGALYLGADGNHDIYFAISDKNNNETVYKVPVQLQGMVATYEQELGRALESGNLIKFKAIRCDVNNWTTRANPVNEAAYIARLITLPVETEGRITVDNITRKQVFSTGPFSGGIYLGKDKGNPHSLLFATYTENTEGSLRLKVCRLPRQLQGAITKSLQLGEVVSPLEVKPISITKQMTSELSKFKKRIL